jgi:vacuolar-type H+-ATPase subunit F/Vma7
MSRLGPFCPCNAANRRGPDLASAGIEVIWFYEKKGEHLRCEIRQQIEGDRFALVVTLPDGSERTEVFDDGSTLNRRSVELEKMLRSKGWNGPFARDI